MEFRRVLFRSEPGGQNAERQWRPLHPAPAPVALLARAGGTERRKAMETRCSSARRESRRREPGGQNAERQWRPVRASVWLRVEPGVGGAERRKAMETERAGNSQWPIVNEAGRRKAARRSEERRVGKEWRS